MLSSAVALAHAVGRLPENLRLEFDHMINAPQQTPENIKTTINHVLPWLQKMQEQGGKGEGEAPLVQHSASTGQYRYSTDGGKTCASGPATKPDSASRSFGLAGRERLAGCKCRWWQNSACTNI